MPVGSIHDVTSTSSRVWVGTAEYAKPPPHVCAESKTWGDVSGYGPVQPMSQHVSATISCIKNTGRASALSYPTFYIAPRIDAIGPQVRGIGPSLPHWGWAAPFCWLKSGHMQTLCDAEIFSDSFVGWAITEMKNAASSGIPSAEAYFIMCARKYMSRTCSATFAPLFTAILRLVARRRRNVAVMANGWRDPIADTEWKRRRGRFDSTSGILVHLAIPCIIPRHAPDDVLGNGNHRNVVSSGTVAQRNVRREFRLVPASGESLQNNECVKVYFWIQLRLVGIRTRSSSAAFVFPFRGASARAVFSMTRALRNGSEGDESAYVARRQHLMRGLRVGWWEAVAESTMAYIFAADTEICGLARRI
ncbi:hypothetical protein C8J57DRAFT_1254939 [Mycena rebaudengoi]|nr:hypothetical protein C8J57DRAFT_1254939 [Mycena rebaudengoi]